MSGWVWGVSLCSAIEHYPGLDVKMNMEEGHTGKAWHWGMANTDKRMALAEVCVGMAGNDGPWPPRSVAGKKAGRQIKRGTSQAIHRRCGHAILLQLLWILKG